MIQAPGIYDLRADVYHGNCCDGPSLSSSGARQLLEECPASFWWNSPLNPEFENEQKRDFDIGTAAHVALLEPETWRRRVIVIEADSYRGKEAREQRDEAYSAGLTPLLSEQAASVFAMSRAILAHPIARTAWSAGKAEPTYIWRDGPTGVWLKARPDFIPDHGRWIVDYKTTTSAHPRAFARRVFDMGHFQQAAWYIDGVAAVTGKAPAEWWFVVQETKPPYLVNVFKLHPHAVEWGRVLNRRAIDLFAECAAADRWPGYGETAAVIDIPEFAHFQLNQRHEAGEFAPRKPTKAQIEQAREFQAP